MNITKIKSLERPSKVLWEPRNQYGANIIIAPTGWGKTHLVDFIMRAWVKPTGGVLPYRIEARTEKGIPVVLGTKDQSINSIGMRSSMESGKDAIMYYPGRGKRVVSTNDSLGSSMQAAMSPILDMKIGMQNSILVIDDVDFGMDAKNAAEYVSVLHQHASAKNNQIIATTSRREIEPYLSSDWCTNASSEWHSFRKKMEEFLQVEERQ